MQEYIKQQLALHPSITPQDAIKMCFQAAYGAEHLLTDIEKVRDYFLTEFSSCVPGDEPVAEFIAPEVCRVNLAPWKRLGLPWEWLFNLFVESAGATGPCHSGIDPESMFFEYVNEWSSFARENGLGSAFYFDDVIGTEPRPVHHSQQYRDAERPAYRVISGAYTRLVPILTALAGMENGVIAIDGRAASGKSTLAKGLKAVIGAEVVHMDDFFLPPELRTPERLAEPGGNIHYERFTEEVLPFITNRNSGRLQAAPTKATIASNVGAACGRPPAPAFQYRIFDCTTMAYNGTRKIQPSNWLVVEGAYSRHPKFGNYMTLRVFSDIDPQTQMQRITARNGPEMAEMFAQKWIPMEENYIMRGILPCSCKTIFQLTV